jgi:hypothetical protein
MTETKARGIGASTDETRTIWQCRYFVPELPPRLAHERLEKIFTGKRGPFIENDVYLIGSDIATNIKIRKRTRTIKIKVLLVRECDGFERWRTELDDVLLPAPAEVWRDVLSRLQVEGDDQRLATCSDADQVVDALCRGRTNPACVETPKRRVLYAAPEASVEVAEVTIGMTHLHSVEFKSPDLARARAIHNQLSAYDLGTAESYMSVISRIVGVLPSKLRD